MNPSESAHLNNDVLHQSDLLTECAPCPFTQLFRSISPYHVQKHRTLMEETRLHAKDMISGPY